MKFLTIDTCILEFHCIIGSMKEGQLGGGSPQVLREAKEMNQSRWQTSAVRTVVVVLLIMSLLVTVQAVAAAIIVPTTPELVGPSGPFLVNLESVVFNADHTSDWTYKVECLRR